MSIQNNTNGLVEVLNMVNMLDSGDSGSSSGGGGSSQPAIQTYGPTRFTTSGGSGTMNCGFEPDAFEITHGTVDGYINCAGAIFSMESGTRHIEFWSDQYDEYVWMDVSRTSNGLRLQNVWWESEVEDDYSDIDSPDNFYCRAIKYT